MIEENYVSFDTAKLLKEAGFDEVCSWAYYRAYNWCLIHERNSKLCLGYYSRPTQSLAARWLREAHGICIILTPSSDGWMYDLYDLKKYQYILCSKDAGNCSYEEGLEEALQQALTLIHGCPKQEPINSAPCTYK